MTQPQQPWSPYDAEIAEAERLLNKGPGRIANRLDALYRLQGRREGWLLRDAQAKAEDAPLLAALPSPSRLEFIADWIEIPITSSAPQVKRRLVQELRDAAFRVRAAIAQAEAGRTP